MDFGLFFVVGIPNGCMVMLMAILTPLFSTFLGFQMDLG
jgi:hypothetical protein